MLNTRAVRPAPPPRNNAQTIGANHVHPPPYLTRERLFIQLCHFVSIKPCSFPPATQKTASIIRRRFIYYKLYYINSAKDSAPQQSEAKSTPKTIRQTQITPKTMSKAPISQSHQRCLIAAKTKLTTTPTRNSTANTMANARDIMPISVIYCLRRNAGMSSLLALRSLLL